MIATSAMQFARTARLGCGIAACALLVAGCGREPPKAPEKAPIDVTVLTVQRADVPVTAIYVAQTQSVQAVNIQARVSGWLDKRVYVEGAVVKNGQVMFQMDPKPFQAQVDAAKAALERQQAAMVVAKQNLDRTKPLAAQNALSQKDLDDATGQYAQTQAAVQQAQAQLETAQLNLSYTTIRAPVDGVSSYALVADGTYLSPTNAQLTTVSVLTPMWINFSISENEMERIRNDVRSGQLKLPEGGKFVVEVEMVDGNLFPYTGAITFADPSYNPTTGTFLLRATVNNPAGVLRPNQYVRVRLTGAIRPNAVVVPQRAVQQSAKGHFVWVVNAQNKAELRPVVVGEWKGEGWLIAEGLANGDKVVVDGDRRRQGKAGGAHRASVFGARPVRHRESHSRHQRDAGAANRIGRLRGDRHRDPGHGFRRQDRQRGRQRGARQAARAGGTRRARGAGRGAEADRPRAPGQRDRPGHRRPGPPRRCADEAVGPRRRCSRVSSSSGRSSRRWSRSSSAWPAPYRCTCCRWRSTRASPRCRSR
jgi:membrane fusion protein (multidrug efflux system)